MKKPKVAYLALGAAFILIGLSGQRAFIGVGVVFLVLGFVQLRREKSQAPPASPPIDPKPTEDPSAGTP